MLECPFCDYEPYNQSDLFEHQRYEEHMFECGIDGCQKEFYNRHNLHQHQTQSRGHSDNEEKCNSCNRWFPSKNALFMHQENTNRCRQGLQTLSDNILANDHNGFMSRRLIESGPYENRDVRMQYSSTPRAYDQGRGRWVCFCDRDFGSRGALDQHLASPYHDPRNWSCPSPECGFDATTISALMQHIERRSCKFGAFEVIQRAMANGELSRLFSGQRSIAYH